MAIQSSQAKADAQQLDYLGLGPVKRQQVRRSIITDADTDTDADADADAGEVAETPKKKGSMLPMLVGAAAVVFLMAQK